MGWTLRRELNRRHGNLYASIRMKGGWGFRNLHIVNMAMLGKLA